MRSKQKNPLVKFFINLKQIYNREKVKMKKDKIALVTGANRGIGLEICRQLAEKDVFVILTARDQNEGAEKAKILDPTGGKIIFHQLDVNDTTSINNIKLYIENNFNQLDILVNNAAIYIDGNNLSYNINPDIIRQTLETNLMGPIQLNQAFIPLMRKNNYGRIVNLSSGMGAFSEMSSGYPGYRISKTALNSFTKILATELLSTNILVNTMSLGWVRTEMGGPGATRSVEEGADTAVWLSLLPDNGPSGKFFRDRKEIPW